MFNHVDGIMRAWAKKKTQLQEDLLFAVSFAGQNLSKHCAELTPTNQNAAYVST
jgi:hypothetical protein